MQIFGFSQALLSGSDGVRGGPVWTQPETQLIASCHLLLIQVLLGIFSWYVPLSPLIHKLHVSLKLEVIVLSCRPQ
jgi:hypothetical protein